MADDRPQYQHGTGTIGGTTFHWGSGTPGKYWSVPYGDYPVTPDAPTGAWAQRVGAIPIANNVIPDSLLGRNRIGIMIHSGSASSLDQLYTQGCFKVAPNEWPAVKTQILSEAHKGPLYLHVQPGGVASFTNTKTMEQASIPTVGSPLPAASPRAGFLDSLSQIESNNQNIFSGVDKDYPGQPGSRSQGYYQIDTPTWQQFAAKAGVDVNKYPSAMNAPQEVQAQVASLIPLSRFGARTQRMLGQQFGQLDTSKTVGELASQIAPGASGGTTTAATTAAPPPPTPGELLAKGDVGGAVKALWTKPPPKKDAKGNEVEQKSTLENVVDAFGSKGGGQQQQGPAPIPEMQPMAPVQDPTPGLAPAAQQLWSTVAQASARPLSWTSDPYGANAGLQRIRQGGGTTLNNTGYGYS